MNEINKKCRNDITFPFYLHSLELGIEIKTNTYRDEA